MKNPTLKELPPGERPYERCEKLGAGALSDAELIAVIIRSGSRDRTGVDTARDLIGEKGLPGLEGLSLQELTSVKGIGRVKALQLQCVFELSRRTNRQRFPERPVLDTPDSVFRLYGRTMAAFNVEHMMLLMLDTKLKLIREEIITKGTVNTTLVGPREIFVAALKHGAVSIVLLHNHPSGDPSPSREDDRITDRIASCGRMLNITLLDHMIMGDGCYYSYRDRGKLK